MDEEHALDLLNELMTGSESIPADLRLRRGLDAAKVERVIHVMQELAVIYHDRTHVPKRLAASLIDLRPLFDDNMRFYDEETQVAIEDAAIEIVTLAYKIMDGK